MSKHTVNSYILLDRTGSMADRWEEALNSINAYVEELGSNKDLDSRVTVAAFDYVSSLNFDILRRSVEPKDFKPLTDHDATPRGMTPLLDALTQLIALAEDDDEEKAVIVIMTDGAENSSKESSLSTVKASLERCDKRGWEAIFLGADFDSFNQANSLGMPNQRNMTMSTKNYSDVTRNLASKVSLYASSSSFADAKMSMDFTEEDRKDAVKE